VIVDCVLSAPIDSTGRFAGCERMPSALRAHGLAEWPIPDLGNLQVVIGDPRRHPQHQIIGFDDLVAATGLIRQAMKQLLVAGRKPLFIGGCCSILIGLTAAVQDVHPGAGLVFVDGHYDLYPAAKSQTGEVADMELGIILGRGPIELTGFTSRSAIQQVDEVVVLGPRDLDEMLSHGVADPQTQFSSLFVRDEEAIHNQGAEVVGREALAYLQHAGSGDFARKFWVHIDLDVLSTEAMPSVDYPQPGGLNWEQLTNLITPFVNDPGFLGLDLTILNPTLDSEGVAARNTVDWLSSVLG
jgi:arginase